MLIIEVVGVYIVFSEQNDSLCKVCYIFIACVVDYDVHSIQWNVKPSN